MSPDVSFSLTVARTQRDLLWCKDHIERGHYLHTWPDPRTRPLAYQVWRMTPWGNWRIGCLVFGRPEATRCYKGELTYGSLLDVSTGRAIYDRWEVLNLSRVWLDPSVQCGGLLCLPEMLPGFIDRKGAWRPALASHVIGAALRRVGFEYLLDHPVCFVEQPYLIRAVLSYCDTRLHRGSIYRASGFELARTNAAAKQTWWTSTVSPLTSEQDAAIRSLAATHPRSIRIREAAEAAKGGDS
jgi:hypothetical protein